MLVNATPETKSPPWSDYTVDWHTRLPDDLPSIQARLSEVGAAPPLEHRAAWLNGPENRPYVYVVVRNSKGQPATAFPVIVASSSALAGHRILRVERFAAATGDEGRRVGIWSLLRLAHGIPRVLRAHLQVYSHDSAHRQSVADAAEQLGFFRASVITPYRRTVVKDLTPSEEEIFASFSSSCRRNIREPSKKNFEVREVVNLRYAARCQELLDASYGRTGTTAPKLDWRAYIEMAGANPELFTIIGTFQPGVDGPEALVAFGCGRHCGEYAEYSTAASARLPDSNVALTYAPVWELMKWARANGASLFDLGGISEGGEEDPDDPLGGISDFKRYFTDDVVEVGDEWMIEPRPVRSRIASTISRSARWLRQFARIG